VVGNFVVEIELAEPTIGKMQPDFFTQTALVTDPVTISDDEHPDHQFWIDGGAADLAVKGLQLLAQIGKRSRYKNIHSPQQVVSRYHIVELKLIK
jgi:hypothetical protein